MSVFIEVLKVFVKVCNNQRCGIVIAKIVWLLTLQVVFGNRSILRKAPFQTFWKVC